MDAMKNILPILLVAFICTMFGGHTRAQDWVEDTVATQVSYPKSHHVIRYEAGRCPQHFWVLDISALSAWDQRHIMDDERWTTEEISFNSGASWQALSIFGAAVSRYPSNVPYRIDLTDLLERYDQFWIRCVEFTTLDGWSDWIYNGSRASTSHGNQFNPDVYYFNKEAAYALVSYPRYELVPPDKRIAEVGQSAKLQLQGDGSSWAELAFSGIERWEIAEINGEEAEDEWSWQPLNRQGRLERFGPFVHRDRDYRLAIRPILLACPNLNLNPDTAYITVAALEELPGLVRASQDSICPGDDVTFTLESVQGVPLYWQVNWTDDARHPGTQLLSDPQSLLLGQQLPAETGHTFTTRFTPSPQLSGSQFWRRFEADFSVPPCLSVSAVYRTPSGFLYATPPRAVPIKRPAVGGYVSEPHVLCSGGALPAPLTLQHALGLSASWESSSDSLNWTPTGERGWHCDPPLQTRSLWYRAQLEGSCGDRATSEPALVKVVDAPTAGRLVTIYGGQLVCYDEPMPLARIKGHVGNVIGWRSERVSDGFTREFGLRSEVMSLPEETDQRIWAKVSATGCPAVETEALLVRIAPDAAPTGMYYHSDMSLRNPYFQCIANLRSATIFYSAFDIHIKTNYFEFTMFSDMETAERFVKGEISEHPEVEWRRVPELEVLERPTTSLWYVNGRPEQHKQTSGEIRTFHPLRYYPDLTEVRPYVVFRQIYQIADYIDCQPIVADPVIMRMLDCEEFPVNCVIGLPSAFECSGATPRISFTGLPPRTRPFIEYARDPSFSDVIASIECSASCTSLPIVERVYLRGRLESTDGGPTQYTSSIVVDIQPPPVAGTLQLNQQRVCSGEALGSVRLLGHSGQIVEWQRSIDGVRWTGFPGTANALEYALPALYADTWIRAVVARCNESVYTEPVLVRVLADEQTRGGRAVADENVVCPNERITLRLTGHRGQVLYWLRSFNNWATAETLDVRETEMEIEPINTTVEYAAMLRNSICTDARSQPVRLTLEQPLSGTGRIQTAATTFCPEEKAVLELIESEAAVLYWESSADDWVSAQRLGTDSLFLETEPLGVPVSYRAAVALGRCETAFTPPVDLRPKPVPQLLSQLPERIQVCADADFKVDYELEHVAAARWETSLDQGVSWQEHETDPLNPNELRLRQTAWLRRIAVDSCGGEHSFGVIRVFVIEPARPVILGPQAICTSASDPVPFLETQWPFEPSLLTWERESEGWHVAGQGKKLLLQGLSGTSAAFRLRIALPNCPEMISETHVISLSDAGRPATVQGPAFTCAGQPFTLTASGFLGRVERWEKVSGTCATGGAWQPLAGIGEELTVATQEPGTTACYRVMTSSGPGCPPQYSAGFEVQARRPALILSDPTTSVWCTSEEPQAIALIGVPAGATLVWQRSTNQREWIDLSAERGASFTPSPSLPQAWYRAWISGGDCGDFPSLPAEVRFEDYRAERPSSDLDRICGTPALEVRSHCNAPGYVTMASSSNYRWREVSKTQENATLETDHFTGAQWIDLWTSYRCGSRDWESEKLRLPMGASTAPTVRAEPGRVCPGREGFSLRLTETSPVAIRWEASTDGFRTVSETFTAHPRYWVLPYLTRTTAFRAVAHNDACGELPSEPAFVEADSRLCPESSSETPCPIPDDLRIERVGPTTALISWTPSTNFRNVVLEVKANTPAVQTWLGFVARGSGQATYELYGLRPGTDYLLRVRGNCGNKRESGYSEPIRFQTPLARKADSWERQPDFSYRLYPNPTRGQVTVEFNEILSKGQTLRVSDLAGREVQSWILPAEASTFQFDTKGWASGLYVVSILENGRVHSTTKLIVQD